MQQRVVCAAIQNDAGYIVCGPRHYDHIMREQIINGLQDFSARNEQGFVDQFGKFLTREEAYKVAVAAGQIVRRCGGDEGTLYSENLY